MDHINTFKSKRVLVTGDTGFKGSWLCAWLNKLGAHVYGFALPPVDDKCNFNLCKLKNHIKHIDGDVRTDSLERFVKATMPEYIFHLAAQPIVLESYKDPKYTLETNIMGTVNLLSAAMNIDCLKSIVVVTSDKCYRNSGEVMDESFPLGGDDPYSASKACEDLVATSFYKSFFKDKSVGLSTARAGNVIGGGDRGADRIVPDCIRAIENGDNIELRNPAYTRPWQYVLEPLYGYLKLSALMSESPGRYSDAWNFGPKLEDHVPVSELAEIILVNAQALKNKVGSHINIGSSGSSEREKINLRINSSKADKLLGVRNALGIQDVGRYIVEDYFCEGDVLEQRCDRIDQYMEKVKNGM